LVVLTATLLILAANTCGVPWDPVQVLPADMRAKLKNARVIAPCGVASLPVEIRHHLAEAIGERRLVMADPQAAWNSSCLRGDDRPSRQLIAAANAGSHWVVHYREGGEAVTDWAVVVELHGTEVRPVWRGSCASRSRKRVPGRTTRECAAAADN
jgi:hypothetical protein